MQSQMNINTKLHANYVIFLTRDNNSAHYYRIKPILDEYPIKYVRDQTTNEAIKEAVKITIACISRELLENRYTDYILHSSNIDDSCFDLFDKTDIESEFPKIVKENAEKCPNLISELKQLIEFYFKLDTVQEIRKNQNNKSDITKETANNSGCMFFLSAIIIILLTIFL